MKLSVVLPVHNEESGIDKVINRLVGLLRKQKISFEVICVENGSTDNSLAELDKLAKKYQELRVFQSSKGWGNAVCEGVKRARGEYFCYMVSDNQVDSKHVVTVFSKINNNGVDLVKVARKDRENFARLVNSRVYNLVSFVLFGFGGDINATPKILETGLIRKMKLQSENIALDLELLLKLKKDNHKWFDIPVTSRKREGGISSTNFNALREMLVHILKFKLGLS